MTSGRLTSCTDEFIQKALHYIDNYDTPEYDDSLVPSIAGLAVATKIARSTLHAWKATPGDNANKLIFSDIYDQLMAKQEVGLKNGGLSGAFNSTISKLFLTKHNYSDKQELMGEGGAPLTQTITLKVVDT